MVGTRRTRQPLSVRARVLLAVTIVAGAGLAVAGALTFTLLRGAHARDVDERLVASVESARGLLADSTENADLSYATTADALRIIVGGIIPTRFQSSIGLIDGDAVIVPSVDVSFSLDDPELVAQFTNVGDDVLLGGTVSQGRTLRYVAAPVTVVGAADSGVYVTAFDLDAEYEELNSGVGIYAVTALTALAAIVAVAWYISGRALAPIQRLNAAAGQISGARVEVRIPVTGNDDVSALTRTINAMLDRLETSARDQRQLVEDVRHELATPIAIMQGHLEVVDLDDRTQLRRTHDLVLDELDRMSGLVEELHALAAAERPLRLSMMDVAALTQRVFAKVSAIPGHAWRLGGAAEVTISADAARLTQAWLQLADNAAKYSPSGEPIAIGSTATDREVELWVLDRGPGVPDEARERIFQRFGRAESGRTERGSGLGLAIVAAIAKAHDGRVTLHSRPGGSTFVIAIPRTTRPG